MLGVTLVSTRASLTLLDEEVAEDLDVEIMRMERALVITPRHKLRRSVADSSQNTEENRVTLNIIHLALKSSHLKLPRMFN